MTLDLPDLADHLWRLLAQVPLGKVTTYRAVALAFGDAAATRWVGQLLLHHSHEPNCPCHRVVQSDGHPGRYIAGSFLVKKQKLEEEGIGFHGDKLNVDYYCFRNFVAEKPLRALRALQEKLSEQIRVQPCVPIPTQVGGVDVAYPREGQGVAAYALMDVQTGRLLWSATVQLQVRFPYIPTYLAFRELPLLLALLHVVREQGKLAPVVLVDGTGILHPRHAGIASHLGVLAQCATIGLTKKLLCGQVRLTGMGTGHMRPVFLGERLCGMAWKTKASAKPVYLSPGHGVDLDFVHALLPQLLRGHRLPEPLYWADRLSRAYELQSQLNDAS
ncbi:MAG TPA: endonuclease V [Candidatus Bipolaricaulota bacterium]